MQSNFSNGYKLWNREAGKGIGFGDYPPSWCGVTG